MENLWMNRVNWINWTKRTLAGCEWVILFLVVVSVIGVFGLEKKVHAQENSAGRTAGGGGGGRDSGAEKTGESTSKLFGGISLLSNYVVFGLTQTQKDPAVQTEFGYQLMYLRLGIWGSNVKYYNGTEHLNLQPYADYKMIFTENTFAHLKVAFSSYYSSSLRNGVDLSFDLNLFSYHFFFYKDGNWQGTNYEGRHIGAYKEWIFNNYLIKVLVASNNISEAPGYHDYFNTEFGAGYKYEQMRFYLIGSYATESSQFSNGQGDPAVLISLQTTF